MRTLIVLAALTAATVANAQGYRTTMQSAGGYTTIETHRIAPVIAPPDVYAKPTPEDEARSRAREAAWQDRCKPTVGPADPNTGMRRMIYAAPGCEYGD